HGPHVDRLSLGPTEQAGIEREGGFALARVQFAPVDTTGRPRGRRRLIAGPFEEHESRAMRIAGNGETANAGNVFGAAMNGAARRLDAPSIDVHVVDCDIAHPSRPDDSFQRISRDPGAPADPLTP